MSTWNDENRWYARLMKLAHELAMEGRSASALIDKLGDVPKRGSRCLPSEHARTVADQYRRQTCGAA